MPERDYFQASQFPSREATQKSNARAPDAVRGATPNAVEASRGHIGEMAPDDVKPLYPGLWHALHLAGAHAVDESGMRFFKRLVDIYCKSFPCVKCREHLRKFRDNHPLTQYVSMKENGREVGMAQWTWLLHNSVNRRLGKPEMSWDTFSRIWLQTGEDDGFNVPSCSKNCSK